MSASAFSQFLKREFDRRRDVNLRFSLRAYATLLDTDHATISQILRGARKVPILHLRRWASTLGLTKEAASVYFAAEQTQEQSRRERLFREWSTEGLALLEDPAHWHIIRLSRQPDFQADSRWIAAQANLTIDSVNMAFSRLLRLKLIHAPGPNRWIDQTGLESLTEQSFYQLALTRIRPQLKKDPQCPTL